MAQLDEYLRAVEQGLRCPAERRPALIEELRTHLQDRGEALVAQGEDELDAQRQATREMGPAWLLALRLSAANGWSVTAHVFREIWAMGLGVEATALGMIAPLCFGGALAVASLSGSNVGTAETAYLGASWAVLVTALPAFGFAMGRLVRGWLWAIVPAAILARQALVSRPPLVAVFALAGAAFFLAVLLGARREHPTRRWLPWAGFGLLLACSTGWPVGQPEVCDLVVLPGLFPSLLAGSSLTGSVLLGAVLALPWLFWFAAWLVGRHPSGRVAGDEA